MFRPFLGPGFPLLNHHHWRSPRLRWLPFKVTVPNGGCFGRYKSATSSMPNDCHPSQALMQSHSIGVFCLKTSLYFFEASKEKCNKGKQNMIYIYVKMILYVLCTMLKYVYMETWIYSHDLTCVSIHHIMYIIMFLHKTLQKMSLGHFFHTTFRPEPSNKARRKGARPAP